MCSSFLIQLACGAVKRIGAARFSRSISKTYVHDISIVNSDTAQIHNSYFRVCNDLDRKIVSKRIFHASKPRLVELRTLDIQETQVFGTLTGDNRLRVINNVEIYRRNGRVLTSGVMLILSTTHSKMSP